LLLFNFPLLFPEIGENDTWLLNRGVFWGYFLVAYTLLAVVIRRKLARDFLAYGLFLFYFILFYFF